MELHTKIKKELLKNNLDGIVVTNKENIKYCMNITDCIFKFLIVLPNKIIGIKYSNYIVIYRYENFKLLKCDNNYNFFELKNILKNCNITNLGFEKNDIVYGLYEKLKKFFVNINFIQTENFFEKLREIKTIKEIKIIKHNAKLTEKLLMNFFNNLVIKNETEIDIEKKFEIYLYKNGIKNIPFRIEISAAENIKFINRNSGFKRIKYGDLLIVDFGIERKGYVTDITRTFIVGIPNKKQILLYKLVRNMLKNISNQIISGKNIIEIVEYTNEQYNKLGLKNNLLYDIGHGIGINYHESPFISKKNNKRILKDMIICLEPGIYLNSESVRLEDMVLVTENGIKFLTKSPCNIPSIKFKGGD